MFAKYDNSQFDTYSLNDSDSLIPYDMAANGNLNFIKNFLAVHPHFINQPWSGNGGVATIEKICEQLIMHKSKPDNALTWLDFMKWGTLFGVNGLFLLASMNPLISGISLVGFVMTSLAFQHHYVEKHRGWTLLDFAAETGRTDVAMYLIDNNADLNNSRFLDIARAHKQDAFLDTMQWAIKNRGIIQHAKNKLAEITLEKQVMNSKLEQLILEKQAMHGVLEQLKLELLINTDKSLYHGEFIKLLEKQLLLLDSKAHLFPNDEYCDVQAKNISFINEFKDNHVGKSRAFIAVLNTLKNSLKHDDVKQCCEQLITECKSQLLAFMKDNDMANTAPSNAAKYGSFFEHESRRVFGIEGYPFGLIDKKIAFIVGDCFYDSVIANCPNKLWSKIHLRAEVKQTMLNNEDEYRHYMKTNSDGSVEIEIRDRSTESAESFSFKRYENYSNYCEEKAKDGAYIDNLEIIAFTKAKQVCCIVIPQNADNFHEEHIFGREFLSENNPPIFVGHETEGQGHYVALKTIRTWQEVWDEMLAKADENKQHLRSYC